MSLRSASTRTTTRPRWRTCTRPCPPGPRGRPGHGGGPAALGSGRARLGDPGGPVDPGGRHAPPARGDRFLAVCDDLDTFARPGIAMPEHVVHITPAGCCPATEPNPVLGQLDLVPALSTDPVATGAGVRVVVIDTGRRRDVEDDHPEWLSDITGAFEGPGVGHYGGRGTFVCGVLRSQAPECAIDVNAVTVRMGSVAETSLVSTLLEALKVDHPDLISMSAGTTTGTAWLPSPWRPSVWRSGRRASCSSRPPATNRREVLPRRVQPGHAPCRRGRGPRRQRPAGRLQQPTTGLPSTRGGARW